MHGRIYYDERRAEAIDDNGFRSNSLAVLYGLRV